MRQMLLDRELAGRMLSKKLEEHIDSNTVVFGLPPGGVCVADEISRALGLPLETISCRRIKHPGDERRSIGSVSMKDICIHNCSHTIPQGYIAHQIALLRHILEHEREYYYGAGGPVDVHYKTVILVVDILSSSDSILACVREIRKQLPLKLIVAAPVVSSEAARVIRHEADDIVFLNLEPVITSPNDYFVHYPDVTEERVRQLLADARKRAATYQLN